MHSPTAQLSDRPTVRRNREALLNAFIERRRHVPFAWGSNDCCLFAADWILELTGRDHARDLRGAYSTMIGAAHAARAEFADLGNSLRDDLFAAELWPEAAGLKRIPPSRARRGDLAVVISPLGLCRHPGLAVVLGLVAAIPGEKGLNFLGRDYWKSAFGIPSPSAYSLLATHSSLLSQPCLPS